MIDREPLDKRDRALLATGWCCDCGGELLPGPRGGLAQNFYCANRSDCRHGFNLTFVDGQLLIADRIGEVDDERFAMYAR
jgi:hypothetical protein